jgi:hypothetical protein
MALGDGIRRNISQVEPAERAMLRDAILKLHQQYYPGARGDMPPGGVSWWFKQDEIHQATHVHGGPEFLPWHRELTNRLEELIRQIEPQLSLHYWDFKDDPRNIPNGNVGGGAIGTVRLFDDMANPFMGSSSGPAGDPWLSAGFYDPQAGQSGHPQDRDVSENPVDPPSSLDRSIAAGTVYPIANISVASAFGTVCPLLPVNGDADILSATTFPEFRVRLECVHNMAHGYIGGTIQDAHISFRDPFVFLLHSNVDRLFAEWQTDPAHPARLVPGTVYGAESSLPVTIPNPFGSGTITQNLTDLVEPWSTGTGHYHNIRPWEPTHENQGVPHDYHDISVVSPPCYDTNKSTFQIDAVENPLDGATNRYQVIFNDVPEEETTWRAAVIRVYTCPDTTFRVKPGTEPGTPFGVAVAQATALHGAHPHSFQDVHIWFQYTAGAVGSAPHSDGPVNTTIKCDETGQEFLFELRADTIHRPTVAVQMVLDQTGSMAWPAGTSGLIRLDVLKGAAGLFATVIQNNNGLGIVRFDEAGYPPNDPTYPGLPMTRIMSDADRTNAQNVIAAITPNGDTSVGNGLMMGHNQVIAVPITPAPGGYDSTAIMLLTDGIENYFPLSISDAIGMGAIDSPVYAVGLGNEFQVNTGALNAIAGTSGGNLLLSGVLTPSTDDFFRMKKFFLQIFAGVSNTSIVRDPTGYINVGTKIKIPFDLTEADINCRLILLTDFPIVKLSVQMPNGQIIDEVHAAAFGVVFKTDGNTKTSSFNLPVAFQATKMQAGTWQAILEIDAALYKRTLAGLGDRNQGAAVNLKAKGARYCLSVHSFSNLRMTAAVTQNAYEPGSTLSLRATLMEYNLPVDQRAVVNADIEYPDHTLGTLAMPETQPGEFKASMIANIPGIYRFLVRADGATYRGAPFTREQVLNAAVFHDIHQVPGGSSSGGKQDWCKLLSCLLDGKALSKEFEARLQREGINLAAVRACVRAFCSGQ